MIKLFAKRKKWNILRDLTGAPYKFYRGGACRDVTRGRYFCSCFDIARKYRKFDDAAIIETEIVVKNPLVIDATREKTYSHYSSIYIHECEMYPENKRIGLLKYIDEVWGTDTLSTDEILAWAIKEKDIDAVIIKNIKEGVGDDIPIYDIMIWNEKNLVNTRSVTELKNEYESFRQNTFKRVDLTKYLSEKEKDGIARVIEEDGYYIECVIQRGNKEWCIRNDLLVYTDSPIKIYCTDTKSYVTVEELEDGVFKNTPGHRARDILCSNNGIIRVEGMRVEEKYRIEQVNDIMVE